MVAGRAEGEKVEWTKKSVSLIHPDLSIWHLIMFLRKTGVIKGDGWRASTLLIPEAMFVSMFIFLLFPSLYSVIFSLLEFNSLFTKLVFFHAEYTTAKTTEH